MLDEAGGGREKHVGSDRGDDDGIDVAGGQAALSERLLGRLNRKVTRGYASFHDVALADADAAQNPIIRGVDHLLEVGVGKKAGRHVGAEGTDLYSSDLLQRAQGLPRFVQIGLLLR